MEMTRLALALAVAASAAVAAAAQPTPAFTEITPPAARVQKIALHPLEARRLLALAYPDSLVTGDGGATWSTGTLPAVAERLFVHNGSPGVLFLQEGARSTFAAGVATIGGGATYRSTDFGLTWSLVNKGITRASDPIYSPFASDPREPDRILATVRSPFMYGPGTLFFLVYPADVSMAASEDGGLTWRPAAQGLPQASPIGASGANAPDPPVPAANYRMLYTHPGHGTFRSDDGARSWKPFLGEPRFRWVKQDPFDDQVLYAWGDGGGFGAWPPLMRSDDGGKTWLAIFQVANSRYNDELQPTVVPDPSRRGRLWLTGLEAGVFLSQDGGSTWTNVGFAAVAGPYSPSLLDRDSIVSELVTSPDDSAQVYLVHRGRLYRGLLAPAGRVAVEYSYGDRFWLTGDRGEALFQDHRANDAVRTGERFGLWSPLDAPPGAAGICRFQGNPARGQTSRFVTLQGAECEALKRSADWRLEGEGEYFAMPPGPGGCAAGLAPVTRFFNGKALNNHRYVTTARAAGEMRARGWIEEGLAMCARPLGEGE